MKIQLSDNIRTRRKSAGLTQEQLAEALGVTTGAVYKWESGKAVPELEMLVDIATFFETSVDALLDYGWEKLSMGQAVEKLRYFSGAKQLDEGMRYAEQALQKYPNSFEVVFYSAQLYFLTMEAKHMPRAVALYEKALGLMDQNTNPGISAMTIQNRIAYCYAYMDRREDAIKLLKKHNTDGINNAQIGLLLSRDPQNTEEALKFLSDALVNCYSTLYNICIGYANAYEALGKLEEMSQLIRWLYQLGKGLRDPQVVNWMDRGDVKLFLILAEADYLLGKEGGARDWLVRAKEAARQFDSAPNYQTGRGLKFCHGSSAVSYDDMGPTAMEMIETFMADAQTGRNLSPLWAEIQAEI